MIDRPRVSVVTPHYDDLGRLNLLLNALERQDPVPGGVEIIVADNGSPSGPDPVRAVIAGRARLTVVNRKGAGAARNGGVAEARGDVIAFTDADCIPEPAWLSAGLAALETVDLVGGRMRVLTDDPATMTAVEAFEAIFAFDNKAYVERQNFSVTANLFCRRETFERVGGFVTAVVSEDREWCLRAAAMGYQIGYAPDAVVGHPARRTWDELVVKTRRIVDETFGLFAVNGAGRLRWVLRTLALPLSALAHTPKALTSRAVPSLEARLAATVILYRIRFWRLGHGLALLRRSSTMRAG
jgi:glycosyltransferase involved in cell wall biosynthesis